MTEPIVDLRSAVVDGFAASTSAGSSWAADAGGFLVATSRFAAAYRLHSPLLEVMRQEVQLGALSGPLAALERDEPPPRHGGEYIASLLPVHVPVPDFFLTSPLGLVCW